MRAANSLHRLGRARPALLIAAVVFALLVQFAGLARAPGADRVSRHRACGAGARSGVAGPRRGLACMATAPARRLRNGWSRPSFPHCRTRPLPSPRTVSSSPSMPASQEISPGILRGEPISFALRAPDVLEAIRAVAASRQIRRAEFFQRVPTDRWWEATIAPLALPGEAPKPDRDLVLADAARPHAAAPGRGNAGRFRRQCEPRTAHAARLAVGLHRDAAGLRRATTRRAGPLPCHHEGAGDAHGAPDRRPVVAVADRAEGPHPSGQSGRSGGDRA